MTLFSNLSRVCNPLNRFPFPRRSARYKARGVGVGWPVDWLLINEIRGRKKVAKVVGRRLESSGVAGEASPSVGDGTPEPSQRKRKLALVLIGYYADERCRNEDRSASYPAIASKKAGLPARAMELARSPRSLNVSFRRAAATGRSRSAISAVDARENCKLRRSGER